MGTYVREDVKLMPRARHRTKFHGIIPLLIQHDPKLGLATYCLRGQIPEFDFEYLPEASLGILRHVPYP